MVPRLHPLPHQRAAARPRVRQLLLSVRPRGTFLANQALQVHARRLRSSLDRPQLLLSQPQLCGHLHPRPLLVNHMVGAFALELEQQIFKRLIERARERESCEGDVDGTRKEQKGFRDICR
jgi:hypothetical protein